MEKKKYMIVDDNQLAQKALLTLMKSHTDYECIGQYYSVITALSALQDKSPQFIFLDIEMPHLNGFELIRHLDTSVKVVITTSHRDFAGDSFDYGALDFLSKPVNPARLLDTLLRVNSVLDMENKAKNNLTANQKSSRKLDFLMVTRLRQKEILGIKKKRIYLINKVANTAEITLDDGSKYYQLSSLHDLMDKLSPDNFSFVNNRYIINLKKTLTQDGKTILLKNGEILKIAADYQANFKKLMK